MGQLMSSVRASLVPISLGIIPPPYPHIRPFPRAPYGRSLPRSRGSPCCVGTRTRHGTQDTSSRASSDTAPDAAGVPLAAVARALTDEMQFVTTNDGVPIAYDSLGKSGPVIVLVHGWSGSRHYFELNARVSSLFAA